EQRTVLLVTAAPVLMSSRDSQELSRSHALLTSIILVQIRSLDDENPNVIGVRVHTRVVSRRKLCVGRMCPVAGISPDGGHRDTAVALRHVAVFCLARRTEHHFVVLVLRLNADNATRYRQRQH